MSKVILILLIFITFNFKGFSNDIWDIASYNEAFDAYYRTHLNYPRCNKDLTRYLEFANYLEYKELISDLKSNKALIEIKNDSLFFSHNNKKILKHKLYSLCEVLDRPNYGFKPTIVLYDSNGAVFYDNDIIKKIWQKFSSNHRETKEKFKFLNTVPFGSVHIMLEYTNDTKLIQRCKRKINIDDYKYLKKNEIYLQQISITNKLSRIDILLISANRFN